MLTLLLASLLATTSPQAGGSVEVRFNGARPGGPIMVQLCTEAEFMRACRFQTILRTPAGGGAVARFTGVPAGRYAVVSFQDTNNDGRLNFGLMGAPSEPWGYSRGARGVMGPPRFADAAVTVAATGGVIPVALGL